jgi:putative NADH-flavin reductase
MKITIFGATGKTGQYLLSQALEAGHDVTVLVRNPSKLQERADRVRVVQGNVLDAAAVDDAVAGSEAVLSLLGPSSNKPTFEISQGTDNILAAMRRHGVRRLVISAGAGVRDPQDRPTPLHAFFGGLVRVLSPNVVNDMQQVVDKVRASDLDWTIVRAPMLIEGPRTGRVWAGPVSGEMGPRVSRANFAHFVLQQVDSTQYLRQAPAICEPKSDRRAAEGATR